MLHSRQNSFKSGHIIFGVKIQILNCRMLNVKKIIIWIFAPKPSSLRSLKIDWFFVIMTYCANFFLHLESVLAKMVLVPPPWVFHDFSEFYGCLGLILLGTLLTVFEVVKRFIELLVICLSRDAISGSRFVHQSNHNIHPFLWLEEILKSDLAYIFRKRRSWL